ncbi:MAG: tripartite tricarboxylate transporter TctB family protein [Burkholderiaceae bacterium]
MAIKDQRDFWSGVMFAGFGVFFVGFAQEYDMGTASRMGPAFFPTVLGALLAFLGGVIALKGLVTRPTDGTDGTVGHFDWRAVILVLGAVAVFAFLLKPAGIVIAMMAMITIASLGSHEFKWLEIVGVCAVMGAIVWAVFIYGLKLTIPVWPAFITG